MKSITVEKLLGNNKNYQQVTGNEESLKRVILTGEINRPGFELAGFFKHSDFRRIIVFGDKEMAFIAEMTEERQKEIFPCLINEEVPCIVICKGHPCPEVLKNIADERNFPIFQTEMITGVVSSELMNTLEEKLARETLMHGVFLNIHGKGVIIKGDSGIGKSEIALELVKRGHLLVADDAVELYRIGQKIVGKAPAVLANLLEIRGIGVIDVSKMFGISAILDRNDLNDTNPPKNMEIQIFPGASSNYEMYEDDGLSSLYEQGFYLLTSIDYTYQANNFTVIIRPVAGKSGIITDMRSYKIRFRNTKEPEEVSIHCGEESISTYNSYIDDSDYVIELPPLSTLKQITINCKGKDIEIDALRLINDDIDSILSDLPIETKTKDMLGEILFSNLDVKQKRIRIRKLRKYKLNQRYINLFLKLLEYIAEV